MKHVQHQTLTGSKSVEWVTRERERRGWLIILFIDRCNVKKHMFSVMKGREHIKEVQEGMEGGRSTVEEEGGGECVSKGKNWLPGGGREKRGKGEGKDNQIFCCEPQETSKR